VLMDLHTRRNVEVHLQALRLQDGKYSLVLDSANQRW
jgi:hypothetical protein